MILEAFPVTVERDSWDWLLYILSLVAATTAIVLFLPWALERRRRPETRFQWRFSPDGDPAHLAVWYNMFGHLASAGLTWNDVKIVPVPTVNDGVDALMQGRADVTQHALNSAKVREADAAIGVRHVSDDCSPEGDKRLRTAVPGYYPRRVKAGSVTAVLEDGCYVAYDTFFAAGKALPEAVVEAALKALWDNESQLAPIHPMLKEWTRDRAVGPDVTIPYHPGAIRFYKERGVWTPEMDEVQQRLLSANP